MNLFEAAEQLVPRMQKAMMDVRNRIIGFFATKRERLFPSGSAPGEADVSTMAPGEPFEAKPNFYYHARGRPCRLPLFSGPQRNERKGDGWCVTGDWPCEYRSRHSKWAGPYCWCEVGYEPGDWVQVIGAVRGQWTQDDRGMSYGTDLWYAISIPSERIEVQTHLAQPDHDRPGHFVVYASALWLGDTGDHQLGNPSWLYSPTYKPSD